MSTVDPTWQDVAQPPDEKMQGTCFRDWKYKFLNDGLKILRDRICGLQQRATSLGIQKSLYLEELHRIKRMIEWGDERLKRGSGLIEDNISVESLRYLKAGLLLLIIKEKAKLKQSLPERVSEAIKSEIQKLAALAEDRWFEKLKPIDLFFEIVSADMNEEKAKQANTPKFSGDPIRIFYCYSSKDVKLRNKLQSHLSAMKREKVIKEWYDREIFPGDKWEDEIDENLNRANIVLLLVTADFIESDYCYTVEMERALDRHKAGECRVIPVILKSCDWHNTPFAKFEVLPTKGKEVTGRSWKNQDEAFADIANGIRKAIGSMQNHKNEATDRDIPRQSRTTELNKERETHTVFPELGQIHIALVTYVRAGRGLVESSGSPQAFNPQQMDAIDKWQTDVKEYLRLYVGPYALLEFEKPLGNGGGMLVDNLYPKRLECSKLSEQVEILNKMAANPRQFMPPS